MVLVAKQVKRCPSRSVKRSCAPGCGRSLRTMTRIPLGQEVRFSRPVISATQAPGRDLAVGVVGGCPRAGGQAQDRGADVVGDGEADGVLQPPARTGQPGEELVGAAAGVGADQDLAASGLRAVGPGPAGWRRCGRRRCWSRRCLPAACMASGSPAAVGAVVGEGGHGVEAEGLLPGRGGVFLVGVGDDDGGVQVDGDQFAVGSGRGRAGAGSRRVHGRWRGRRGSPSGLWWCRRRAGRSAGRRSGRRRRGRTVAGWERRSAMSARQSPPRARLTARSAMILPGSWIARAGRHRCSCSDRAWSRPVTRSVSSNSSAPAWEMSPEPSADMTILGREAIVFT